LTKPSTTTFLSLHSQKQHKTPTLPPTTKPTKPPNHKAINIDEIRDKELSKRQKQ